MRFRMGVLARFRMGVLTVGVREIMSLHRKIAWISLVIAIVPIGSFVLSIILSSAGNCQVNESSVNVCMLFGVDVGGLIYNLMMMGWYALITLPLGFFGLCIALILKFVKKL